VADPKRQCLLGVAPRPASTGRGTALFVVHRSTPKPRSRQLCAAGSSSKMQNPRRNGCRRSVNDRRQAPSAHRPHRSNTHSAAAKIHRVTSPRGFLPQGFSDACPLNPRVGQQRMRLRAGIGQPLMKAVIDLMKPARLLSTHSGPLQSLAE